MRLYHQGDRGAPVRDVQERLAALGFECAPDELGVFGAATFDAVLEFQSSRGIPPDGIVGPETWKSLVEAGYRLGDRMLYHRVPMMRGDDVAELQARLNSLGFDSGKVDGVFGPDTLKGLLDFQHNRHMAEDGIAGVTVAEELRLVDMATQKQGREAVRERQWLETLPRSIAGQHIYLDPECRSPEEAAQTWSAAAEARTDIQNMGGRPTISRSVDTTPPPLFRAQKSRRMDVDIVVGFAIAEQSEEGIFYFSSEHSESQAGRAIAEHLGTRLAVVRPAGRVLPILKETRAPAVVLSLRTLDRRVGHDVAQALAEMYRGGHREGS